jgi:hypothetical protein
MGTVTGTLGTHMGYSHGVLRVLTWVGTLETHFSTYIGYSHGYSGCSNAGFRLDRMWAKLRRFELAAVELVGTAPIGASTQSTRVSTQAALCEYSEYPIGRAPTRPFQYANKPY